MSSQLSSCSFNKHVIHPLNTTTETNRIILNGVVEIFLSKNITDTTTSEVVKNAQTSLFEEYGDIVNKVEHIIMCLPYGTTIATSKTWKAYAFVNNYLSIYNDKNCNYLSVLMHELGHNMGLAHSNDEVNYGDWTGVMGTSYKENYGPLQCFNGAKSWVLGMIFIFIMIILILFYRMV